MAGDSSDTASRARAGFETINAGAPRIRAYDNLKAAADRIRPDTGGAWEATTAAMAAALRAVDTAPNDDAAELATQIEIAAGRTLLAVPASTPEQMIRKLLTAFMTVDGHRWDRSDVNDGDIRALFDEAQLFLTGRDGPQEAATAREPSFMWQHGELRVALQQVGAVLEAATQQECSLQCSLLITAGLDLVSHALAEDDRSDAAEASQ
ncbi:hypothetical protein [Sphingomonas sanxanigenens]|nr:hypothetical protein [Sphingomonas sanxanigenens]